MDSDNEADPGYNPSGTTAVPQSGTSQKDFLKHMEEMLQKALKATYDQITNRLSRENRQLGQRRADLETRNDDMELTLQEHA